jgi:hypothetical protein
LFEFKLKRPSQSTSIKKGLKPQGFEVDFEIELKALWYARAANALDFSPLATEGRGFNPAESVAR